MNRYWTARVTEIAQREFEDSLTVEGRVADPDHLGKRIASALTEVIDPLYREVNEGAALQDRMAQLLTDTANALKGDPGPLHLHDWSDLPDVAEKAAAAAAERTQE